jgi:uncharacterized membrane protein
MATTALEPAIYDNSTTSGGARATGRIVSLDFVRGIVMILMAIDHVRVYAGVPAGGPTPGVFFTRWITHFVAPAFVFLAGTAAFLHGQKLPSRGASSKFLLTRGAILILLELTVIRIAWTFNLDFANYMLAGVIWMIGWCMILLAAAIYLPTAALATIGVAIIALHNLTDVFSGAIGQALGSDGPGWFLTILYFGWGPIPLGGPDGPPLGVLFTIVPWIGVMMSGYAFGQVMQMSPERRRSICLRLGVALTTLFLVLRAVNVYGDPNPWGEGNMPAVLSFLATTKYPASLLFLLMTLGPMFILLGFAERWHGKLVNMTATFGRVPMFYYLLHIPVIHFAACAVSLVREGQVNPWLFGNHPLAPPPVPDGYMWSLGLLYTVLAVCVVALHFPCQWYARMRAGRRHPWLSYL